MRQEKVELSKELLDLFGSELTKDLQKHERVCPTCKGLGIRIVNNPYGLKNDPNPEAKKVSFPYKHQSVSFCGDCYNGVQRLCGFCGKPVQRGYISKCDCGEYLEKERIKAVEKYQEKIKNAKLLEEKDVTTYLYSDELDRYFSESYEYVEYWEDNYEDEMPNILWVCSESHLAFDAHNIIEQACEDLHEDAFDNCDISGLQCVLDDYAKEQDGTLSYYPSYKEYIIVK